MLSGRIGVSFPESMLQNIVQLLVTVTAGSVCPVLTGLHTHTHTRICIYIVFVGQSLIDFAEGRTHAAYAQYLPFGTCEPNEAGKINK